MSEKPYVTSVQINKRNEQIRSVKLKVYTDVFVTDEMHVIRFQQKGGDIKLTSHTKEYGFDHKSHNKKKDDLYQARDAARTELAQLNIADPSLWRDESV